MVVNDDGTCGVSSLIVTTADDPSTVRIGTTDAVTSILGPNVLVPGLDLVPQNGTANISAVAVDSNTGQLFKVRTWSISPPPLTRFQGPHPVEPVLLVFPNGASHVARSESKPNTAPFGR